MDNKIGQMFSVVFVFVTLAVDQVSCEPGNILALSDAECQACLFPTFMAAPVCTGKSQGFKGPRDLLSKNIQQVSALGKSGVFFQN